MRLFVSAGEPSADLHGANLIRSLRRHRPDVEVIGLCDQVLASLPFEEKWLRDRGIPAEYIGHPYFDELAEQRLDPAFMHEQRQRPGPVVGLLPGSRNGEVRHNLDTLIRAAGIV